MARAAAAIAEAELLCAKNRAWQAEVRDGLRRMMLGMMFHPKSLKPYSPDDFPEQTRADQPLPSEIDG